MHKSVKTCFLYFVFAATAQWVLRSLSFWSWSSVKSRPQAKNVPRSPPRFKSTPIQFHYEGRTDGCKLWEEWWWKIFSSHLSPFTQRKISLRKFMDFNPFLTVNCKTWESKFVRCHVPSDHCVWSDLFQRALKSLTGRWWRGGTRHFHWCWDLPLESHPIISFQWISPDFGIYPGLQTRFPWIRRLCFQILSSLILRHCSALLQRNALECLVEMYPQCKEQSLLRKSSSQ